MMQEKAWRSIVKALSWRVSGSIGTMFIAFVFSGKISVAVSIGFVEFIIKFIMFFLHERLWNRIPFGRYEHKPPDFQI